MIVLAATSSRIKCKLSGAGTSSNFFGVWADGTAAGVFTPGNTQMASNGTTDVVVAAAPGSGVQRQVKHVYVYNGEVAAITVTTSYEDVSATRILSVVTIQPGASADVISLAAATGPQLGLANTWTAAQTFSGGILGVTGGLQNRFINSGMSIDRRNGGAAQTFTAAAALAYCVNNWYGYCTGANVTGQQVAGTAPNQYNYRFTGAGSVTKIGLAQRIEAANSQDLAGQTAILSVDMANSLLTTVTWVAYYASTADTFGSLASPSKTQIATGTFTVSSTLARYNAQLSIPAGATTGIEIEFSVAAQTSGTWTIGRAQLEPGIVSTLYEHRHVGIEEMLCDRYLPQLNASANTDYIATGIILSTSYAEFVLPFRVQTRVPPTGIAISGVADFGIYDASGSSNATVVEFRAANKHGVRIRVTGTGTPYTAGRAAQLYINSATAKMLFTGADL